MTPIPSVRIGPETRYALRRAVPYMWRGRWYLPTGAARELHRRLEAMLAERREREKSDLVDWSDY